MASTPVVIYQRPGETLTAEFYPAGSDTAAASALSLTEATNREGTYTATVTTSLTGLHHIIVHRGTTVVGKWEVVLFDITDELEAVELGTALLKLIGAYPDGFVYADVTSGVAGTVPGINGTFNRPCSTLENAVVVAELLSVKQIKLINGGTFTMTADLGYYKLTGSKYLLNPATYSLDGSEVENATISQTFGGLASTQFHNCYFGGATCNNGGSSAYFYQCRFLNEMFLKQGTFHFVDCYENTPLSVGDTPEFNFQSTAFAIKLNFIRWTGNLSLSNMTRTDHIVNFYGTGTVTINDGCTNGTILLHGNPKLIDNVTGGFAGTITRVNIGSNMLEINDSDIAAQTVQEVHEDVDRLTVINSGTLPATTTVFETDGADTANDTFKGKTGTWYNASGNPANKGSFFIASSLGTVSNPAGVKITLDSARPLSVAPADGDVFIILGARSN